LRRPGLGRRILRAAILLFSLAALLAVAAAAVPIAIYRDSPPPTSAFILLSRFADPATGQPCEQVEHESVEWARMSPDVRLAVVAAEDQRFFQHSGLDWKSIESAVEEALDEGRMRGASTISQQVAKNLFLWPGRSIVRKGLEVWLVFWIEATWSKQHILETYLNVAQFGPCVFGVEAASQRFFETTAAELSPEQAALLAAVLPNPYRLRAHDPGPWVTERTQEILGLMDELRDTRYLRGRI